MTPHDLSDLRGKQILLLEDQAHGGSGALNIAGVLTRLGAKTTIRVSVSSAKRAIEAQRPLFDAVLIDFNLVDDETGTDFALWLQRHDRPELRAIPRISYSGAPREEILSGADDDTYHALVVKGSGATHLLLEALLRLIGPESMR